MSSSTTVQGTSAPKKLSWLNIIGYGMGDASNNVGWQMMNMFLTTYYIYMGINPAVVAAIFSVRACSRLWCISSRGM